MLAVYVMMIHKGVITINDVPSASRDKVRERRWRSVVWIATEILYKRHAV
ncbi:hypothetical protein JCM10914A_10220 [Paenibacillus sp. JCM 10914]|nr:hypothetical protein [Paenibacillus sp. JCM 10914]